MRKLAREAAICALLGLLVTAFGCFVFLAKDVRAKANVAGARAVRAFGFGRKSILAGESAPSAGSAGEFLPDGFVATKDVYQPSQIYDTVYHNAYGKLSESIFHHRLIEVRLTNGLILYIEECMSHADENEDCAFVPVPSNIERDYWAAYKNFERDSFYKNGIASLYFGMWGFAGGLGIWLLYRMIAFAIRG